MTEAYPLQWPIGWPRTALEDRERGYKFRQTGGGGYGRGLVTFAVARDKLYQELERLGAQSVIISTNHKPDIRGMPIESKRKVDDDGVAIYFRLKGRDMAMACDRYDGAAANMRSLGLAIEGMRQLERHGGGTMVERAFTGFAALPAPENYKKWWDVLECAPTASQTVIESQYHHFARIRHPDKGGSEAAMAELNAAREAGLAASRGA